MAVHSDLSLKATGNVTPSSFIKIDTTSDGDCALAGANEQTIGVSHDYTRNAPGTSADDGYIAISGETVPIYGPGQIALVKTGTGGVTRGGWVKSDAAGLAVAVATTGTTIQNVAGVALQSVAAGGLALVRVTECFPYRPALS